MPVLVIDTRRCLGCGLCVAFCPRQNLTQSAEFTARGIHPAQAVSAQECTGCKVCVLMCPSAAICIYRDPAPEAEQP